MAGKAQVVVGVLLVGLVSLAMLLRTSAQPPDVEPTATAERYIQGLSKDVNRDNIISVEDAIFILNRVGTPYAFDEDAAFHADVDFNNVVTVQDAQAVLENVGAGSIPWATPLYQFVTEVPQADKSRVDSSFVRLDYSIDDVNAGRSIVCLSICAHPSYNRYENAYCEGVLRAIDPDTNSEVEPAYEPINIFHEFNYPAGELCLDLEWGFQNLRVESHTRISDGFDVQAPRERPQRAEIPIPTEYPSDYKIAVNYETQVYIDYVSRSANGRSAQVKIGLCGDPEYVLQYRCERVLRVLNPNAMQTIMPVNEEQGTFTYELSYGFSDLILESRTLRTHGIIISS